MHATQHTTDSPNLEQAWDEFVTFLKRDGARITHSRRIVFRSAMAQTHHFRADDLAASLVSGPDRVSRGTVYRTLGLMVEAGFLRKVRDDDRHSHYEPSYGRDHHEHMICRQCGTIIEFEDPGMNQYLETKCREHGFEPQRHRVTIMGLCRRCRSTANPSGGGASGS